MNRKTVTDITTMFILLASLILMTIPAYASCLVPRETGEWINHDPATSGITRIQISFQCQDQVHYGNIIPAGAPYNLHLFGSCSPTDCDWGEAGAEREVAGWIHTSINQGFATRNVWIQTYPGDDSDWLRVYVATDFADPGRADYALDEWFVRR